MQVRAIPPASTEPVQIHAGPSHPAPADITTRRPVQMCAITRRTVQREAGRGESKISIHIYIPPTFRSRLVVGWRYAATSLGLRGGGGAGGVCGSVAGDAGSGGDDDSGGVGADGGESGGGASVFVSTAGEAGDEFDAVVVAVCGGVWVSGGGGVTGGASRGGLWGRARICDD